MKAINPIVLSIATAIVLLAARPAAADIFQPTEFTDEQQQQEQQTEQPEEQERQFLWDRNAFMSRKPGQTQRTASDAYCFSQAETAYAVSGQLLRAISKVESNHQPHAINWNKNKSYDYCHMQINSYWAPIIGMDAWNRLSDPCYCTMVGAWILSQCIHDFGYTWEAVGCYNAKTKSKAAIYSRKVERALNALKQSKQ